MDDSMSGTVGSELPPRLAIVSGIPAGDSGTGRFVAHLASRIVELGQGRIKIVAKPERPARWQFQLWLKSKNYGRIAREAVRYARLISRFWIEAGLVLANRNHQLILLHPQNLGYDLALRLLESRSSPSLLYLLDSSFFCVASYNHLKGEAGPCLRCLELGFEQVAAQGCRPFPRPDPAGLGFAPRLRQLTTSGKVKIAAQNQRQAALAQRQFGLALAPPVVGLWTSDWDDIFGGASAAEGAPTVAPNFAWDVVFHGYGVDAKGANWTVQLAEQCPELRFMFPFAKPVSMAAPDNCSFLPCSWETGLSDELSRARFVAVPSLWSAPIEGALIKSIAAARATLVVDNATSYCDELPAGLVLKLPPDPATAAMRLRQAIEENWVPDPDVKAAWKTAFSAIKARFVPDLLATV